MAIIASTHLLESLISPKKADGFLYLEGEISSAFFGEIRLSSRCVLAIIAT